MIDGGQVWGSGAGGVTSLNLLAGALTLIGGTNVTITTPTGNTIRIDAAAGGAGISSINASTIGAQTLVSSDTDILTVSTNVGTGVTTFSLITGTAANDLLQLNASAQLPAVDIGTLGRVFNPFTEASSDLNIALTDIQAEINSIIAGSITTVFGRGGPAITAQTGDYIVSQITGAAPLANPTFTGIPAAPTASPGTSTTQLATTAFVGTAIGGAVTSFNTRVGAVTAQNNDYAFSQISGTLPVVQGGTGLITYTPGDLIFALANTVLGTLPANIVGKVLITQGAGVPPRYSANPVVDNISLVTLGSPIVIGSGGNTMTFSASTFTGALTFALPDANCNPVQPSSAPANQFAYGINSSGVVQYAQPSPANFGYTVVHKTNDYQFLDSNIMVIMDADAKTGTLPDATTAVPGVVTYVYKLGVGATTGTLAVPFGQYLNDVLNGTFALSGAENSASAISDGTNKWYTV